MKRHGQWMPIDPLFPAPRKRYMRPALMEINNKGINSHSFSVLRLASR
ncbi:hypothetical protein MHY1_02547 [Methylovirgula sp. HY1]|nr:hypothetical protein MHY1_02547 [Methylovirgula sp. HY1]